MILPVVGLARPGLGEPASYKTTMLSQTFSIGDFLAVLITFVMITFVIFLMVKVTKRWGIA
jgi:large-conductance mechanosensitive channel